MPTVTAETNRIEGITFVEVVLEADCPHRIRLEPRFDGTIWPPRTNGSPVDGWDDDGVTTEIGAGRTAIGFATPVLPEDRPVELVRAERIGSEVPDGVAAWIERMERRLETAEVLCDVDDLAEATEAVAFVGGLSAVESLAADVTRDRRLTARVSVVPDDLRERLESVEVPTSTFARLARRSSTSA